MPVIIAFGGDRGTRHMACGMRSARRRVGARLGVTPSPG
ncbi:hypothetical protein MYA_5803 [Burkholderia sp. KJ006]|nr:hypothetical protein MYA_5803 [Burkholderia sp. KJ006]